MYYILFIGLKTTLIYPATERHITKYCSQEAYLVSETPGDYANITLPYIEGEKFSIQVEPIFFHPNKKLYILVIAILLTFECPW